jgi:serine/threonine-protein kinase
MFAGFTIDRVLGAGGMGTVYLARHPRLERHVALKILNDAFAVDPATRAAFDREAALAARLDHPNIVTVHDRSGPEDPALWLSMRYIPGGDANTLLAATPTGIPVEQAVDLIADAAAALDHAHSHGVLHRDVKPANLLIESDPRHGLRALLTDFGIARTLDDTVTLSSIAASFPYTAPERFQGLPADHRADVYSLGCTLYQLLTGEIPFPRPSQAAMMAAHLNDPPPAPSRIRAGLPAGLDAVITTALAKTPADRYPTCNDLAAAAAHALTRTSPATTRPAHRDRTDRPDPLDHPPVAPKRSQRLPRFALIAAGPAIIAAVAAGLAIWHTLSVHDTPHQPPAPPPAFSTTPDTPTITTDPTIPSETEGSLCFPLQPCTQ